MRATRKRLVWRSDGSQKDFAYIDSTDSHLRLQTIIRLRWVAVLGQLATVCFVWLVLGFPLPVGSCLSIIALSAWINVFLAIRYPARHRLSVPFATVLLAYDIIQLAALLYVTGGIENPFTMLIVAPVTVSAATLPAGNTIILGLIAAGATLFLVFEHWPLPWFEGLRLDLPHIYKIGLLASVNAGMTFLAFYAWRLAKESRQMSAALAATELVLAREQKLHALDGLAAAAAHELGTPLSTIVLVTKELAREIPGTSAHGEDIALIRSQAERCRVILQKLTKHPSEQDPLHASLTVKELIESAAAPYRTSKIIVAISAAPEPGISDAAAREPIGLRRPGLIFGFGNLIENAVDFAKTRVDINAKWDENTVEVTIKDDGPGFPPEVMDTIGEPYVTTRPSGSAKRHGVSAGLGLGFFIAKTLLERSGAGLILENRPLPEHGAIVRIMWPRTAFEVKGVRAEPARSPESVKIDAAVQPV